MSRCKSDSWIGRNNYEPVGVAFNTATVALHRILTRQLFVMHGYGWSLCQKSEHIVVIRFFFFKGKGKENNRRQRLNMKNAAQSGKSMSVFQVFCIFEFLLPFSCNAVWKHTFSNLFKGSQEPHHSTRRTQHDRKDIILYTHGCTASHRPA